ncbi:metal ABC transporter permease [Paracoccus sp. S3-43]|nr:metal ABC transporter permease [Paracoccus sp. S3-43]WEF25298.1 metal ABC transporter permease [Paracoccus sp. S3-43]
MLGRLSIALAIAAALSIRLVGSLLISAMPVVPTATARGLSRSPERMVGNAILIAAAAVMAGLWAGLRLDTPAGPSIMAASPESS